MVDPSKCFCAQISNFSKSETQYYSYIYSQNLPPLLQMLQFHQKMICRAKMGTIYRPSVSGSVGTEATVLIQCINGQEPYI